MYELFWKQYAQSTYVIASIVWVKQRLQNDIDLTTNHYLQSYTSINLSELFLVLNSIN